MPAEFERCIAEGGHVVTVKPNKDTRLLICYPKGGGSPVKGETHKVKKKPTE